MYFVWRTLFSMSGLTTEVRLRSRVSWELRRDAAVARQFTTGRAQARHHHLTNTFEVFGGIHAGREMTRLDDPDADAVGEGAQLFQRLLNFQRNGGARG